MITFKSLNDFIFHFNSDFSGEIKINKNKTVINIPVKDLLEFIAYNYILPNRIEKLENMNYEELFNL